MYGLALEYLREKEGIILEQKLAFRFSILQKLAQKKENEWIDLFFAERFAENEDEALLLASLMAASREGHLCISLTQSVSFRKTIPVHVFKDLLYLKKNWDHETEVITHLKRLLASSIAAFPIASFPDLNPLQQEAASKVFAYPFSIISGGPGTGKTFTAARIIAAFPKNARIVLTAPTGKAVERLSRGFSGVRASTLHALLQLHPSRTQVQKQVIEADLILVDECSMIDASLFATFLSSIKEGTRIVLMGDKDQLPPVESGSLFADFAALKSIPSTQLQLCMRSDKPKILDKALAVKNGDSRALTEDMQPDGWQEDFPFAFPSLPPLETLFSLFEEYKILSCIRQGPLGVDTLNARILAKHLSKLPPHHFFVAPILAVRTDLSLGITNGETGILVREKGKEDIAFFPGGKTFPASLLSFEYAYCLSVHKSQGSEYNRVALLIPPGSEAFGKEILYTGITRAKEHIDIYGCRETLTKALIRSSRKNSGIAKRDFLV